MNGVEPCLSDALTAEIEREIADLYRCDAIGLLRYATALAGNPEMARDAVQEAFFRYFRYRSAGRVIGSPKGWLIRVVRNYVLDQMKAGSRMEVGMESLLNLPGPDELPELEAGILDVLQSMPEIGLSPREMECVRLRMDDLPYEAIAGALGLAVGTVGALLARAHEKIRKAASRMPHRNREVAQSGGADAQNAARASSDEDDEEATVIQR